ncbi:MAG TPA: hypothetical protein PK609_03620 [Candidatus Paceibacterota bacterium]|nr:hypothetical protein [Candidatus Paceibacterota bacterium]
MVFNSPDEILLTLVTCISLAALFGYTLYRLSKALIASPWRRWHVLIWDIVMYVGLFAFFVAINLLTFHEVWKGFLSHYVAYAIHGASILSLIAVQTHLFTGLDRLFGRT